MTTYYISPTGSDSNNGTSPSTPWQTIAQANTAASGSTVLFQAGGAWTGKLTPANNNITYGSYGTGAKPSITGSGSDYACYINARNNTTINGLAFYNTGYTALDWEATFQNVTSGSMTNCSISVTGSSSTAHGLSFKLSGGFNMSGITLTNNDITTPGCGDAINLYHPGSYYSGFVISNNNIHDTGGAGVNIVGSSQSAVTTAGSYPRSFDVKGNNFTNIGSNAAIAFTTGMLNTNGQSYVRNNVCNNIGTVSSPHVNAFQLEYCQGLKVLSNTITNVYTSAPDGDGIEIDWAWSSSSYMSNGCEVAYNVITGCNSGSTSSGIRTFAGTNNIVHHNLCYGNKNGITNPNSNTSGNSYYNNTCVYNVNGGDVDGISGSGVATTWFNNIFAFNTGYGFQVANNFTPPSEDHNLFFGNGLGNIFNVATSTPIALDSSDIILDPLFVSTLIYRLQPLSPAIATGRAISNYQDLNTDITGYTSNAPRPDLGAYTYQV